tara:strand:- start:370 stop:789 length:420 start_codon:yes stop_codon:yes gene_type:complete
MHWANHYITAPYVDGGRDLHGLDCWGLVRHVLHHRYDVPLLSSWGHVRADDKPALTHAYLQEKAAFLIYPTPTDGAVIGGFRGKLLIHVGIVIVVDGEHVVLETRKKTGVRIIALTDFARQFSHTRYYFYDRHVAGIPR